MSAAPDLLPDMRANRLLALLPARTLDALGAELRHVPLKLRETIFEEGGPIRHVYFPESGVISMLAAVQGAGRKIEIGTIGNEGMAGLPFFLGASHAPGLCFVQIEGAAWRMPSSAFSKAVHDHPEFAAALCRYAHALIVQVSQSSACNRVHSPLERCARWLLMTADRVGGDSFHMTQEFLGHMLGERRSTVSRVASQLQQRGLISYTRGRMTILDTRRLEGASCDCYAVIRREHDLALCPETRTAGR